MKICKSEYLNRALLLSKDEKEHVLSRMAGKLPKRLSKEELTIEEAIALQLEIEDENLKEWRKNWAKLRKQVDAEFSTERPKAGVSKIAKIAPRRRVKLESIAPPGWNYGAGGSSL